MFNSDSSNSTRTPLVCPICSMNFINLNSLNLHVDKIHLVSSPISTNSVNSKTSRNIKDRKTLLTSLPFSIKNSVSSDENSDSFNFNLFGSKTKCNNCSREVKTGSLFTQKNINKTFLCQECLKNKELYKKEVGVLAQFNQFNEFHSFRKEAVYLIQLEQNKIENTLVNLFDKMVNSTPNFINLETNKQSQMVVPWQDNTFRNCFICHSTFGIIKNKRHHCRVCGFVVCGEATCSIKKDISFMNETKNPPNTNNNNNFFVIMCTKCSKIANRIQRKRTVEKEKENEIINLHKILIKRKSEIEKLLQDFNKSVFELKTSKQGELTQQNKIYQSAREIRKVLLLKFRDIDNIKAQISKTEYFSVYETKIIKMIIIDINNFITDKRLTLSLLPEIKTTQTPLSTDFTTTSISKEEIELNMKIKVFKEQISNLELIHKNEIKNRNIDNAKIIKSNISELENEIREAQSQIQELKTDLR